MRYPFDNFILEEYPNGNVMQWFGENVELYCNAIKFPEGDCLMGHNGLDLVDKYGTLIYPTTRQKVVQVKLDAGGYGKHVRTIGVNESLEYTYGHLSDITCKIGDILEETDSLGAMGNTGFTVSGSTPYWESNPFAGTHLHYGIRKFRTWNGTGSYNIQYPSGDKLLILNVDNGFRGAIDPKDYLIPDNKIKEISNIISEITMFGNLFGWGTLWLKKIQNLLNRLAELNK